MISLHHQTRFDSWDNGKGPRSVQNSWMIDVLSDMAQFARENALPETREALKAAIAAARSEVVSPDQPSDNFMTSSAHDRTTH